MTAQNVKIGLVGVANHGNTIFEAIRASGNLELVSCFDIDRSAAERVAAASGARLASTYEAMLADPAIEAVALVTPNHLHASQAALAAAAGKHLFVEKPIAVNAGEARSMAALYKRAGLVLLVGHNTRRRQVFRRARAILEEGALGRLVAMEGNLSRPAGLQSGLPPWKADPALCPLLPMTQLGIHLVDTAAYLDSPVRRVSCMAANRAMPGNVPDTAAALLELSSGVLFTLSSYYVTPDAYFLRLYGTQAVLLCSPVRLRLDRLEGEKLVQGPAEDFSASEGPRSYVLQMREFGECVRSGREPETGGAEGLHAVAVIEAMSRSAESGATIDLSELLEVQEDPHGHHETVR
ncbi:MAG TPA: Gfo/Idh/MocA family oxidoreductase [Bacteroidota bacterium]